MPDSVNQAKEKRARGGNPSPDTADPETRRLLATFVQAHQDAFAFLLSALSDLDPGFTTSANDSLVRLMATIVQARPEWFPEWEQDWWARDAPLDRRYGALRERLAQRNIPHRQIAFDDLEAYDAAHPGAYYALEGRTHASGVMLRDLWEWREQQRAYPLPPGRVGPPRARVPSRLRLPTAGPVAAALCALFTPQLWRSNEAGTALLAQRNAMEVMLSCDETLGWGPAQALQQIAKYGASAAQTFIALTGFWLRSNPGASYETYLTAHASDLLRFQGRKEKPNTGYSREDLIAKGRDVLMLSRISVPKVQKIEYKNGKTLKSLSIGPLLSVQLDVRETLEDGGARTVVQFRYHLGREVHAWLCGNNPRYTEVSGKLLSYHPDRDRYHILLGFCLAYYDRVSRRRPGQHPSIGLPALLRLAGIEVPRYNVGRFTNTIRRAVAELAADGVIPGAALCLSSDPSRSARALLLGAWVEFPSMLPAPWDTDRE